MKCTQYGLYGQTAFKNPRVRPRSGGHELARPRSGARVGASQGWAFLVLPLPAALTSAVLVRVF